MEQPITNALLKFMRVFEELQTIVIFFCTPRRVENSVQFGDDNKSDKIDVYLIMWKLVKECPHLHVHNIYMFTTISVTQNLVQARFRKKPIRAEG